MRFSKYVDISNNFTPIEKLIPFSQIQPFHIQHVKNQRNRFSKSKGATQKHNRRADYRATLKKKLKITYLWAKFSFHSCRQK